MSLIDSLRRYGIAIACALTFPFIPAPQFSPEKEYEKVLNLATEYYTQLDRYDLDGVLDNPAEQELGIKIIGPATKQDITEIVDFYHDEKNKKRIFFKQEMGLEEIIVLPQELMQITDFAAMSIASDGQIIFFSGKINNDNTQYHEWAHFGIHYCYKHHPRFIAEWEKAAGTYDKIQIKSKGLKREYFYPGSDRRTHTPRFGYITEYGGTNLGEDIATFVENVIGEPEKFKEVTDEFWCYQRKLQLLYEYEFITSDEFEKAAGYLAEAKKAKIRI